MILGIDGSNALSGGGIAHLTQLLAHASPAEHGIERVVVWAGGRSWAGLPKRPWLETVRLPDALEHSLARRMAWLHLRFPKLLSEAGCAALFAPGGLLPRRCPVPACVLAQNLIPFDAAMRRLYRPTSFLRLRVELLLRLQRGSMRRSAGVLFLSETSRRTIEAEVPGIRAHRVVPHGVAERFFIEPRPLRTPSPERPFRLLYVSVVDAYKNQWVVAEAVALLRRRGVPVCLDLVGSAHAPSLVRLEATLDRLDPSRTFLRYTGAAPSETLHEAYRDADAFVFASVSETFGLALLEAMAAGLPIACSNRSAAPEVLGEAGLLFDPERAESIAAVLERLILEPRLRDELAWKAYRRAGTFSWTRCARETLEFVARVTRPAHAAGPALRPPRL